MRSGACLFLALLLPALVTGCLGVPSDSVQTRAVRLDEPQPLGESTLGSIGAGAEGGDSAAAAQPAFAMQNRETPPALPAEGILDLTQEQAVVSALQRNRSLSVETLEPVIAGTFVDTERAVFDPVLFAGGSYKRYEDRSLDNISGRLFSIDGSQTEIRGGVAKRLPAGTDLSVGLTLSNREGGSSDFSDEARLGLNLTQALLRDAGVAVNMVSIRQAETAALASAYSLRGFTESLVAEVEDEYWNYALAVRQVEIFEESVNLAKQALNNIRSRIEVGQLAETEETVADAELALREQQLIDARNEREKGRLALLRLLNPNSSDGWDRQVTLSDVAIVPEVSLGSADEHEALALKLRPDLNEARLQAREGKLQTVQTANGLLPKLDLFIVLGKTGYSQSFANSFNDLDGPGFDFTIGLDYEFPVYNRNARALDRRARARYEQDLESIENLKQLISLDVRNALLEVARSRQQIAASASRRMLQTEVARAEGVRFQVGTATALDVARVQRDLLESRINEVEAIVNYRQALTNLYLVDGTLLLRRGIEGPGSEEIVLNSGNRSSSSLP